MIDVEKLKEKREQKKAAFEADSKMIAALQIKLDEAKEDMTALSGQIILLNELIAAEEAEAQAKKEIADIEAETQPDADTTSEDTRNEEKKS